MIQLKSLISSSELKLPKLKSGTSRILVRDSYTIRVGMQNAF